MLISKFVIMFLFSIFIIITPIFCIDETNIADRFFVVGVISESKPKNKQDGVVVIKDININKTLVLKKGDYLPYSNWKIKYIASKKVIVSNFNQDIMLSYYFDNKSQDSSFANSNNNIMEVLKTRKLQQSDVFKQPFNKDVTLSLYNDININNTSNIMENSDINILPEEEFYQTNIHNSEVSLNPLNKTIKSRYSENIERVQ